jgi:hypothetical protein
MGRMILKSFTASIPAILYHLLTSTLNASGEREWEYSPTGDQAENGIPFITRTGGGN